MGLRQLSSYASVPQNRQTAKSKLDQRIGDTLTTSILGGFNPEGTRAAGTLSAIMQRAQAVAKEQSARQLVIQGVEIVNPRLADLWLKQGFGQTTIRVGKETITVYKGHRDGCR